MTRYALLLRGVNVGPSTTVPMARLRELAEGLGWADVSTYVNSGNLFADCGRASRTAVEKALAGALRDDLHRDVGVVARTRPRLQQVVDDNPFPDAAPNQLHVVFLGAAPSAAGVAAFDAELARHPERGVVVGDHAYVDFVNGAGRSKLDWTRTVSDGVVATARNWRTVQVLLERV